MSTAKLSIVQVTDQLNVGGAERVLVTLSNLFHRHGHAVTVLTTVRPGPLASSLDKGIRQVTLNRGWKWNPITLYRLYNTIKPYDIVHVHSFYNLRYVLLAARLFGLRKKICYHEHSGYVQPTDTVSRLKKYLLQQTLFIAVSERLQQWAVTQAAIPSGQVFLLPNTVARVNTGNQLRKEHTTKRVIIVSNFLPNKNLAFAIRLLIELRGKQGIDIDLAIVGKVYDEPYYREILQQITAANLAAHIEIIPSCNEVQALLSSFDLAIHTSLNESGPLVLIEYLAQGLPFLSYQTGEVAAIIQQELPAFILDSFETERWVESIRHILAQPKGIWQDKLTGLYEKYFSTDGYYRKCLPVYEQALSENLTGKS